MGPIFSWLFGNHALGLGWVLFFATWVGFVVLLMFGKIQTGPQIERDGARDKETILRLDAANVRKDELIGEMVADKKQSLENDKLIIRMIRSLQNAWRKANT
jgi:hypothetical protein